MSSRLKDRLNFDFIIFKDNSENSAYFPRPKTLDSQKSPNSNGLKLTVKKCKELWLGPYNRDDTLKFQPIEFFQQSFMIDESLALMFVKVY